ncbi:unnamed protein product [Choristocarpus tenellus]
MTKLSPVKADQDFSYSLYDHEGLTDLFVGGLSGMGQTRNGLHTDDLQAEGMLDAFYDSPRREVK